jgi:hypothetical protein
VIQPLLCHLQTGLLYHTVDQAAIYGHKFCEVAKCLTGSPAIKCNETCIRALSSEDASHAWKVSGGDFWVTFPLYADDVTV